ncbi:mitochondrial carrier protein [Chloropicon primus]|uniref:Mitochondrial carrier protein n=2 Tax=Chloropicon primus TaxID=1764295 RepID=A0A5B8MDV5_9CHLO|nr:mitochondrial carrier protein [Chloropicon primus]UPQ97973.1 mitochondrial carrier protein [Chloropicon primus]|eukprot:QDZ18766.1 mitochondrial carrier protein [Chloropicon primus]
MGVLKFKRRARGLSVSARASKLATASSATTASPPSTAPPKTTTTTTTTSAMEETIAGGIARAGSQSTIHPIDTVKVRMQAGTTSSGSTSSSSSARSGGGVGALHLCKYRARKVASLYRGVFGAASGAGVAIGAYFALYSWTKRAMQKIYPEKNAGTVAFFSGALAGAGSCVVKVPIAVCIRSVQAKLHPNVFVAARRIVDRAGPRGLFTGFLPTVFEDVPDMAVKFAVYESLKAFHGRVSGRRTNTEEDLLIGGIAGAMSAAATTPWDVVKTRMMCSASTRPTVRGAIRGVIAEGRPLRGFFTGVGPRSLSSGIHTALFFCFYEAIRSNMARQARERERALAKGAGSKRGASQLASIGVAACLSISLLDGRNDDDDFQ